VALISARCKSRARPRAAPKKHCRRLCPLDAQDPLRTHQERANILEIRKPSERSCFATTRPSLMTYSARQGPCHSSWPAARVGLNPCVSSRRTFRQRAHHLILANVVRRSDCLTVCRRSRPHTNRRPPRPANVAARSMRQPHRATQACAHSDHHRRIRDLGPEKARLRAVAIRRVAAARPSCAALPAAPQSGTPEGAHKPGAYRRKQRDRREQTDFT
jgi:hypothetical protein